MIRTIGATMLTVAAAIAVATTATAGIPSPTRVTITMTGTSQPNPNATGNFTAAAPLCTAGTFAETDNSFGVGIETLTCADGSGTITLKTPADFTVLEGTGSYKKLVGAGSCLVNPMANGGFTRACTGSVGFDNKAPTVSGEKLTVTKLPNGAAPVYAVRITFLASDDSAVQSYRLAVLAGKRRLAGASGPGAAGRTTQVIRIHPPAGTKSLSVQLTISDSLGNTATTTKTVTLG
jgi:hypothetical protein